MNDRDLEDLNRIAAEEALLDLEMDIEMHWDEDYSLHLVVSLDDEEEMIVPVEELVEELIQRGRVSGDFRDLYCAAHELDRYQEQVREAAQLMEEGMEHISELYGMDVEDLE